MASSVSQRQMVDPEISATTPRETTSSLMSGTNKRDRGSPRRDGSSQASALTSITTCGGKNRRSSPPGALLEPSQALLEETLAPFADDLAREVQASTDLFVGPSPRRVENDLGSDHIPIR